MTDTRETGFFTCANMCWAIGALLGLATFLILSGQLGLSVIVALIVGVIVAAGVGYVLRQYFCVDDSAVVEPAAQAATAFEATPEPSAEPVAEPAPVAKHAPAAAAVDEAPVKEPVAKDAPKSKAPKKAAPKSKAAVAEPVTTGEKKPRTLKAPRKAGADDLKKLKGVGPKLESTLNELGVWHFDQIAKWSAEEIAWVDGKLRFKGRIERDGWIDQAKILAAGGETEFSSRKKG